MGIGKQLHLIDLLLVAVAVSSFVLPQRVPVLAAASPVPYGGHFTNQTTPPTLAAEVGLAEEFLMESEISQAGLNFFSVTGRTGVPVKNAVTCGVVGYRACLPDSNGRTPKQCDKLRRECIY